ncbi:hypothetical protein [Streptomyces amritsarensis]|uniref:hypothetical protein n=1 Tax=Streptomyces amritsarensis TaxID=681158 RepID=UPI001F0B0923|nr:hypothetical protein [Streptomyces amritsarensis]
MAGLGARALGIRVHPSAAAAALAVSSGTHYATDRRMPGKGDPGELRLMQALLLAADPELREVYRLAA